MRLKDLISVLLIETQNLRSIFITTDRRETDMSVAIITGASSGLGGEFSRQLIRKEKDITEIWLIARRKERLLEMGEELKKIKPSLIVRAMSLDLLQEEALNLYEDRLEREKPRVSWLINAAGFGKIGENKDLSRRDLDNMILLNDKAAVDMTQITIPYMIKNSHILEICSIAGVQPLPGLGVYAASKAFLISYSRSLRFELFKKKIYVTAVCPYWVKDTEFIPVAQDKAAPSAVKHFPLSSRMKSVVSWALFDARLRLAVSTPSPVALCEEFLAKFLPNGITISAWEGIRRL